MPTYDSNVLIRSMHDGRSESHSDVLLAVYVARVASDGVVCCKQKQKLKMKTAIDSEK